jgi:hypothetical protein
MASKSRASSFEAAMLRTGISRGQATACARKGTRVGVSRRVGPKHQRMPTRRHGQPLSEAMCTHSDTAVVLSDMVEELSSPSCKMEEHQRGVATGIAAVSRPCKSSQSCSHRMMTDIQGGDLWLRLCRQRGDCNYRIRPLHTVLLQSRMQVEDMICRAASLLATTSEQSSACHQAQKDMQSVADLFDNG